jgi:D-aminopeptidase
LTRRPRARDLGLPFGGTHGKNNAITDVPGVLVGFTTLNEPRETLEVGQGPVRTGVTAILPRGHDSRLAVTWAGHHNLNGYGELTGTHWIHDGGYFTGPICLTNTHSVGVAHQAATRWMIESYPQIFLDDHGWALPVVGETYDGLTNDICGMQLNETHVLEALRGATDGPIREGNVGGGTGMTTYEFKGGTGTASRRLTIGQEDFTVGVLVQSNFGSRKDLTVLGVPVGQEWPEDAILAELGLSEAGSIIVIVATDLPLLPHQLNRIAKRGAMGIARTGSPGGHYSGDIILAFSLANDIDIVPMTTGEHPEFNSLRCVNDHYFDEIYDAVVESVEEAIINAMVAAESMPVVKPAGHMLRAIDHDRLRSIMKKYDRLRSRDETALATATDNPGGHS